MSKLTELYMWSKCSDAILEAVAASCPLLRVAKVHISQVTDSGVMTLLKACKQLAVLEVQECNVRRGKLLKIKIKY